MDKARAQLSGMELDGRTLIADEAHGPKERTERAAERKSQPKAEGEQRERAPRKPRAKKPAAERAPVCVVDVLFGCSLVNARVMQSFLWYNYHPYSAFPTRSAPSRRRPCSSRTCRSPPRPISLHRSLGSFRWRP